MGQHLLKTKDDYAGEANKAVRNVMQKNMLLFHARQLNSEERHEQDETAANKQPIHYFESSQVLVWKNHSYCIRTKLADGYHPFTPSWTTSVGLFNSRKTNKASLASLLQKNVQVCEEVPVSSAAVIDGLSLVQRLMEDQLTFGDVAMTVLSMAMKEGVWCNNRRHI